ncbi:porin [bacterium]|nr:porin [bacterium]
MKKLIYTGLLAAMVMASTSARANGTPAPAPASEGLEISGAVDIVGGWQHDDKDAAGTTGSIGGLADYDNGAAIGNTSNGDHFRMVVNQVEVDLQKSFGENIRLRADLDFRDLANTNGTGAGGDVVNVEQAYVTANIAAGNGIEFLFGKFNAPVGVESVDSRDNWLISYAAPYRYMTPTSVTGAKIYYAFSDLVDLHVGVVNNLNAAGFGDSRIPSALVRLGFNWGEEGRESTLGISGGFGPETAGNSDFDFYGDVDFMWAASDTISVAAEGVYRSSDTGVAGGNKRTAIAGLAALNYKASDVWDITGRVGYIWEMDPIGITDPASTTGGAYTGLGGTTGFEGTSLSGTLGVGYQIADGAKMKLEYRYDWVKAAKAQANSDAQSLLAQFAYTF